MLKIVIPGSVVKGRIDPIDLSVTQKGEERSPSQLCSYICRKDQERDLIPERDSDELWLKGLVRKFQLVDAEGQSETGSVKEKTVKKQTRKTKK